VAVAETGLISCEVRDLSPLLKRYAVRIRVEDLNADVISASRHVIIDPSPDGVEVSPCHESVDQAVTPAVGHVVAREAQAAEVVRVEE
jgi:hypothetical protein